MNIIKLFLPQKFNLWKILCPTMDQVSRKLLFLKILPRTIRYVPCWPGEAPTGACKLVNSESVWLNSQAVCSIRFLGCVFTWVVESVQQVSGNLIIVQWRFRLYIARSLKMKGLICKATCNNHVRSHGLMEAPLCIHEYNSNILFDTKYYYMGVLWSPV